MQKLKGKLQTRNSECNTQTLTDNSGVRNRNLNTQIVMRTEQVKIINENRHR